MVRNMRVYKSQCFSLDRFKQDRFIDKQRQTDRKTFLQNNAVRARYKKTLKKMLVINPKTVAIAVIVLILTLTMTKRHCDIKTNKKENVPLQWCAKALVYKIIWHVYF